MTKEKRFTRRDFAIYEKGNPICMTLRDVDKRLNELWEENEQLKSDNKQYEILVKSLKDENQKLKLRLKDLGVEYY